MDDLEANTRESNPLVMTERTMRADAALAAWHGEDGLDPAREYIVDLMTDLAHLADAIGEDAEGVTGEDALYTAVMHYVAETER